MPRVVPGTNNFSSSVNKKNPEIFLYGLNSRQPAARTTISFVSWQQRPQRQQRVVEYTTRLGGSSLVISNIKNESQPSQVNAIIASTKATVKEAMADLETQIATLNANIGTRFSFSDESGIITENCYIMNMTYNFKAVDGGARAIAIIQMTIMTDTPQPAASNRQGN